MLKWEQVEALRSSTALAPQHGLGFFAELFGALGSGLKFAQDAGLVDQLPALLQSDAERAQLRAEAERAQAQAQAASRKRMVIVVGITAAIAAGAYAWLKE